MSRTYRRKKAPVPYHITHDYVRVNDQYWRWIHVPYGPRELAKSLAKHHGDHGYRTRSGNGRGPGRWFLNNEHRKYRRAATHELFLFGKNEEYEVMLDAVPHLPYWD